MDKHTVVYPLNGLLLSDKKELSTAKCNNTDESERYLASIRSLILKATCCMSPFKGHSRNGKIIDRIKDQWWPVPGRMGRVEHKGTGQGNFWG